MDDALTRLGIILAAVAVVMGGVLFCARLLWNIRGSWDHTNDQLQQLVSRVVELIASKDRDHERLDKRAAEVASRLERHLEWHDRH